MLRLGVSTWTGLGFRALFWVSLAVSGIAASGCVDAPRRTEANPPVTPVPELGGTFRLMLEVPVTLDPPRIDDIYESCLANQILDGLLDFDVDLHPVPAIAKEWTVSRDGLEYTFVLRGDVYFHNGRPVSADDVKYSLTRALDPNAPDHGIAGDFLLQIEGAKEYASGHASDIRGLEVLDSHRIAIRLVSPYASFLSVLAMDQTKIVPREEVVRLGEAFALRPVGTGPFVMEEAIPSSGGEVVLVANPRYFRGRPYLDNVKVLVTADYDEEATVGALLEGTVDLSAVPAPSFEAISRQSKFRIIRRTELSTYYLGLETKLPPFDDVRVRRAFAHAIDVERLREIDPSVRVAATGVLPPGMFGYSPESKCLSFDPERARTLLAQAGYPGGSGLVPVIFWQTNRGHSGMKTAETLQENLSAVGFNVEFRHVPWAEFDRRLTRHEMQAFAMSWIADLPDPDSFLHALFTSSSISNFFRYENAEVDSLLGVAAALRASHERAQLVRRAEEKVLRDAALVPVHHSAKLYAIRGDLEGLALSPFGIANLQLERVWRRRSSVEREPS